MTRTTAGGNELLCRGMSGSVDNVLQALAEKFGQLLSATATENQLRAVVEDDAILMVEPWLELFHPIDIHDVRSVYAHKFSRIQLVLDGRHALPEQIGFVADMDANVFSFCCDPVDLINL